MATITYRKVGIKAIAACVPSRIVSNYDLSALSSPKEMAKTIETIGIEERRIADPDVCSSDLCFKAAQQLMADNQIEPESIDMILFLSQTFDYKVPATAPILQHRLGLPKTTACLDLSLTCSGYVYGLSTAFAYASMEGMNRILLLVGETFSKVVNLKDKVNAPLYGDAGTATLIEKGEFQPAVFMLYSDGSGKDLIKIPAGGCRQAITPDSLLEKEREEKNMRTDLQVDMDGMGVFNFALETTTKAINETMRTVGQSLDNIDYLIFHQSNKFMIDFLVKRLKFNPKKVPLCLRKYGNTSSASIPLTVASELHGQFTDSRNVLLYGYGAGLSWGTAYLAMQPCNISPVIEY